MTWVPTGRVALNRIVATALFAAVVGGLPIAVELAGTADRGINSSTVAHADQATSIGGPIRLSERLPLVLRGGRVTAVDRTRGEEERSPSVIAIDGAHVTLDLSDRRSPTEETSASVIASPSQVPLLAGFSSGALQLKRSDVALIGPNGATAMLNDVSATITVTRKGNCKLIGSGLLKGQRVTLDGTWTDVGGRESSAQIPLRLLLRSAALEITLDGLFKTGDVPAFAGQAEFRVPNLGQLAAWLGLGRGVEQLQALTVTGPIEWSPTQLAFARANVGFNGDQAIGAMTVKHAGARVSVDGTLGFQELDLVRQLSALMSPAMAGGREPHVLTMIDADLRLSAAKLRAPAIELGRAALSIALKQGLLQAEVVEVEVESGLAGGRLSADLNQPLSRTDVKLQLKRVDAGRMLAEPLRRNALLGRANVTFEGTSQGRTLAESLSTLAGRGQFELAEPGRLGLDVPALVHAAKASNVVSWAAAGKGATPLDALTGKFRVLNGALTIETLQARSGASQLVGSGRIDVPARLMDMSLASSAGSGADVASGTHDVLLLRGTWNAPAISLMPRKPELKVEVPAGVH